MGLDVQKHSMVLELYCRKLGGKREGRREREGGEGGEERREDKEKGKRREE